MEAKNARKKFRRRPLVVGRDYGVVEGDGHRILGPILSQTTVLCDPAAPISSFSE
jgi:hypothetical protein